MRLAVLIFILLTMYLTANALEVILNPYSDIIYDNNIDVYDYTKECECYDGY